MRLENPLVSEVVQIYICLFWSVFCHTSLLTPRSNDTYTQTTLPHTYKLHFHINARQPMHCSFSCHPCQPPVRVCFHCVSAIYKAHPSRTPPHPTQVSFRNPYLIPSTDSCRRRPFACQADDDFATTGTTTTTKNTARAVLATIRTLCHR